VPRTEPVRGRAHRHGDVPPPAVGASTAVAGTEPEVRKVIDQKQSGQRGGAALLDRARALPGAGQIWLVSNGWGTLPADLSQQNGNIANLARFMQSIERATDLDLTTRKKFGLLL